MRLSDIAAGAELPAIAIPITLQRLVMEAGANRDLSLIHHDTKVARATGAPDAFANTFFLMGMFERLMREWAGPAARIRKIGPLRMMIFNAVGDSVYFKGTVESVDAAAGTVTLDMWVESERGKTVTAKALLELQD
ncbi:MAG: acyl dehydratase [Gammaproteobacteria bacterium]|jgi:acyl dehydratase|nr:acyl dehydratase [Gammaproteobacteria bacterium]